MLTCRRVVIAAVLGSLSLLPVVCLADPPADDNPRKVDALFAAFDKTDSPGCAVGVIRDGAFVYKRGYGMGSMELGVPLSPASVFYMGSVSKQFTAASVVLAAEQGRLSLDDDVRKWIPELPDYGHTITLRQMLHHTSGLRDVLGLMPLAGMNPEDIHTTPELLAMLARQKHLNFDPGEEFLYSNSNYMLLAEVVHRATDKTFAQFAQDNIFGPLGMTHTRFYDDRTLVLPGRVAAYSPRKGGGFQVDWSTNYELVGGGGLMSSVEDLLLWDHNFYNNKLGKGGLVKELQTKGRLNNGKDIEYALGLFVTKYRGLPVATHDGALFGYRSALMRFPEQKFSVICLCNVSTANPDEKAEKIADLYLAGRFPAAEKTARPATTAGAASGDLKQYEGLYRNPQTRSILTVTARENGLEIGTVGGLKPASPGFFIDAGGQQYRFEVAAAGGMRLTWTQPNGASGVMERVPGVVPTPDELAEYAGDYSSDELQVTYRLSVKDGHLMLALANDEPIELRPTVHDEFRGLGVIGFVREDGKITGFDLFAGRVRDVRFVRK